MEKILIYSHDTYGLGNIRRSIAIANHLANCDREKNILILSGSPMIHSFRLSERIDYVKLPCLVRTDRNRFSSKYLDIKADNLLATRTSLIKATITGFKPDLIMVDKNPCGVANELREVMKHLHTLPDCPKRVLLLRDILDEAEVVKTLWKAEKYDEFVCDSYDQVLVVGEKRIFDLAKMYAFSPEMKNKLDYCGYISRHVSADDPHPPEIPDDQPELPRVLVMAGGGQDGFSLLKNYLLAKQHYFEDDPHQSQVFCGSELPLEHSAELVNLGKQCEHTSVKTFTDRMENHIVKADVVICMGGYNTICETMSFNRKTIVIPRNKPVTEQIIRARRFEKLGLLRMIHPDQLTPEVLATILKETLHEDWLPSHHNELQLTGLQNIQYHLGKLLERPTDEERVSQTHYAQQDQIAAGSVS